MIDGARLNSLGFPSRNERLQCTHVHLGEAQIADERIECPEVYRVIGDRALCRLVQVLGCRLSEGPSRPHAVDCCLTDFLDPPGEVALRFPEVARSSALAKASTSDLLVDMPDPAS